ncbi:MAG: BlaI/MecI/CopY family transcriptional regulator [Thermoanaerobaculia bacterium]
MTQIYDQLTRRERQIMDILLELGEASAKDVHSRLADPPSYSAVRALLAKLEDKGHIRHSERDLRYVYRPAVSRRLAGSSAISRLVRVFFGGSVARAVHGMVELSGDDLTDEELDDMEAAITAARKRKRQ